MLIKDLSFLRKRNREEGARYYVNQISKEGTILATTTQIEMANRYAYEAFKPILESKNISKKHFFNDQEVMQTYRNLYATALSTMKKHRENFEEYQPTWIDTTKNIDMDEFMIVLNDINTKWLTFQKNLKENKEKSITNKRMKEEITYLGFLASSTKTRNRLLNASHDQNRQQDKEIFNIMRQYITTKELVNSEEYLDSAELRGFYRRKYFKLKKQVMQNGSYNYMPVEPLIQKLTNEWSIIAHVSKSISEQTYKEFAKEYPIETFCRLTPMQISELNQQTMDIRRNMSMQQLWLEKPLIPQEDTINEAALFYEALKERVPNTQNFNSIRRETIERQSQSKHR